MALKKFSHRYVNSSDIIEFMYYHRVIVNFRKTAAYPLYQLHLLVDIPQDGTDLQTYPENFTGNYEIAYGILRSSTDLNADKIYDFHTAFDIEPTKVKMNAPIDMNRPKILNFNRYVINVWNCHLKKILEVEDISIFCMGVK